jgi:hypothetical protein
MAGQGGEGVRCQEPDQSRRLFDRAIAYVDSKLHTDNLRKFWSLLKRGLRGTYVSAEPLYLFRYPDE